MVSEHLKAHPIDAVHDDRDRLRKEVRRLRKAMAEIRKDKARLMKEKRNLMSGMLALFIAGDDMAERMVEGPEVTAWKRARKVKP